MEISPFARREAVTHPGLSSFMTLRSFSIKEKSADLICILFRDWAYKEKVFTVVTAEGHFSVGIFFQPDELPPAGH